MRQFSLEASTSGTQSELGVPPLKAWQRLVHRKELESEVNEAQEQAAIEFLRKNLDRSADVSLADNVWTFKWRVEPLDPGEEPSDEFVLFVHRDDLADWWLMPGRTDRERTEAHNYLDIQVLDFYAYHEPSDGPAWFTRRGFSAGPPPQRNGPHV